MAKRIKHKRRRARWQLTDDKLVSDYEVAGLIDAAKQAAERQLMVIILLLLNTGLRVQELCDLRVADLPCVHRSNAVIVRRGKGGRRRSVPVSKQFGQVLAAYVQDNRPKSLPRRYARSSKDGWLFYLGGAKIKPDQVRYRLGKLSDLAGLGRRITPHQFRHRFATCSFEADGANIYRIKQWLGHSSLATTERYLHLYEMRQHDYGAAIEAAVGGWEVR